MKKPGSSGAIVAVTSAPKTKCPPASEIGCSGSTWAVAEPAAPVTNRTSNNPRRYIWQKYNARVWIVLAAALVAGVDVTDRQTQTIPLPAGKTLSIEVTIGTVRIDGWDKPDVEIVVERRAPAPAQLARVPLVIEDLPAKVSIRALQSDNTTDPALRADVTVRVPRHAVIERVQVLRAASRSKASAARSPRTFAAARSTARHFRERCGSRPALARSRSPIRG